MEDKSDESTEYIIVKVDKNKFVSKESSESIEKNEFKKLLIKEKDYKNRLPKDIEEKSSESTEGNEEDGSEEHPIKVGDDK